MCNKTHQCFITLETLTLTASGMTSAVLPDNNQINRGKVVSIQMRRSGSLTPKSVTGKTLATDAVVATGHLILKNAQGQIIFNPIPLQTLQRDYNAPEPLECSVQGIDLAQSSIVYDGSVATATSVFEVIFEVACNTCNA